MDAVSPFFIVRDLDRALEFYRDSLGFEVTFTSGGDAPSDFQTVGLASYWVFRINLGF